MSIRAKLSNLELVHVMYAYTALTLVDVLHPESELKTKQKDQEKEKRTIFQKCLDDLNNHFNL